MQLWDKLGIPHKGWEYVGVEDLGENVYSGESIPYERCEMCGRERIRYVHILRHPEYDGELRVGCVCASKMIDDYVAPRERERNLVNRVNRKGSFMKRNWRYKSDTGNYCLRYKGENITIMRSKYNSGWGVVFQGESYWKYHGRRIDDFETAKLVAFDLFDEFYESQHQEQPYWDGNRWLYI